jgi:rhodanese-related sulfurtransferase
MLAQIRQRNYIISVARYKEIKEAGGSVLLDLRDQSQYSAAHIPEAKNFSRMEFDPGSVHRTYGQFEGPVVLYSEYTYEASEFWILVTQLGLENIYVLETGPNLENLILNWALRDDRQIMADEVPSFTFLSQKDTQQAPPR